MAEPGDRLDRDPEASQNKSWLSTWVDSQMKDLSQVKEELSENPILGPTGRFAAAAKGALGKGALGQPMSAGISGLNVTSRGGRWNEEAQEEYRKKAAKNNLGGGAGIVAAPLMAGLVLADVAWSYGVARPVSTVALAARRDKFEWDLLRKSWNRSENVSLGKAVIPSSVVSMISDIEDYDPWSDYDLSDLSSNPVFNLLTGVTDGALNVAAPPAIKIARMAAIGKVFGGTTIKSAEDLSRLRQDYVDHARWTRQGEDLDGVQEIGTRSVRPVVRAEGDAELIDSGSRTTYGEMVFDIANETRTEVLLLNPMVATSHSLNKRDFAAILSETDDPNTVNNILLASRGDELAVKELADAGDPAVWRLADMNSNIQANMVNGDRYAPTGEALAKVNQIFDNQLLRGEEDKVVYFGKLMGLFTDDAGQMRGSSDWMPSKRFIVEKIRGSGRKAQYAVQYADYSDAPKWIRVTSDSSFGKPVTSFMQWAGGRKILGLVSRSGARPNELSTEFEAMMNSVSRFRGTKTIKVIDNNLDEVEVRASDWRKGLYQKIQNVTSDADLERVWFEMENEVLKVLALNEGLDYDKVLAIVNGLRARTKDTVDDINRSKGYVFDESAGRMIIDPLSQRQFLTSFTTLNMLEVETMIKMHSSVLGTFPGQARVGAVSLFDTGMKFFRTDVLFRIGYTPKNAALEPWGASFLAHGTILADDGAYATMGRFGRNRVNNVRSVVYRAQVVDRVKKLTPGLEGVTNRELKKNMSELVQARTTTQRDVDLLTTELQEIIAGRSSPGLAKVQQMEVASRLSEARRKIEAIEIGMDEAAPDWRQIPEPITVEELSRRKREYEYISGEDTTYATELQDEIDSIYTYQASISGQPRLDADLRIEQLRREIEILTDRKEELSLQVFDDEGVASVGAQRAAGRPRREPLDPYVVHPKLSTEGRNTVGLANIGWAERFLADVKLTKEQREQIALLGTEYKAVGSMAKPVIVSWDPSKNVFALEDGSLISLLAAKAAGFDNIPMRVVSVPPKSLDNVSTVKLAKGSWLRDKEPDRKVPGVIHPRKVFPESYGSLDNGRVVGKPTEPTGANDFGGDLARGRDFNASRINQQLESIQIALAREQEIASGLKPPREMSMGEIDNFLTPGQRTRIERNRVTLERIEGTHKNPETIKEAVELLDEILVSISVASRTGNKSVFEILAEKEAKLSSVQESISELSPKIGKRLKKIEDVSGRPNWEGSGDGYTTMMVGGQAVRVPSAFNNEAYNMGAGYRAEASAAMTARATWDPSSNAANLEGYWARTGKVADISPNSDGYWEELSYATNTYFRGDKFIQRILEGETDQQLMVWLKSREGVAYQKSMNKEYLQTRTSYVNGTRVIEESTNEMQTVIRLVKQYLPDENVRKRLAARDLGPADLQASMGGRSDLSRIVSAELEFSGLGPVQAAGNALNKAGDQVWQWIASTPEDRLARWPFYDREFNMQLQRMIDVREVDGVPIRLEAIPPMRQAAHRMALDELEKTFYNIRRYNNAVYMSRFLLGFPGAMFNSMYRYGRFAMKEPERLIQAGNIIGSGVQTFGVDEEGNEVNNLIDAVYLVFPGSRNEDRPDGIRVPVKFLDSIAVGAPSLSYGAAMAVSTVVAANPVNDERMRKIMGDDLYELTFPFGIQANPLSNLFSTYQKSALSAIRQFDDESFLKASTNIHANNMAQWEKNGSNPETLPSYKKAKEDAVNFFRMKAAFKFTDSFSTRVDVPGQFMRDRLRSTKERYPDTEDGRERAELAFISKYGEWAEWYTHSTTESRVYVPSTQEAYQRLWKENPELTEELVALNPKNVEMITLLAVGTDGEFSQNVYNYMKDNPLPGDDEPMSTKMNPQEFEREVKVNEGYALVKRSKAVLDANAVQLRTIRDAAETTMEDRQAARDALKANADSYKDWLDDYYITNRQFQISQTDINIKDRAESASKYLEVILGNKKFMASVKDDPVWQNLGVFIKTRKVLEETLETYPKEDRDGVVMSYLAYVRDELSTDPDFDGVWERYFASEYEVDLSELEAG